MVFRRVEEIQISMSDHAVVHIQATTQIAYSKTAWLMLR
jgi:hypothetical protein